MTSTSEGSGRENAGDKKVVNQRLEFMKRHWWSLPTDLPISVSKKATPEITVAISRERGALGSQIGAEAGRRLSWPVYDRELLDMIADRAVLRTELIESIDEHDRPWLMEILTGLRAPGEISSAGYLYHLKHVMAALASHGKCIIVGRGSVAFLPPQVTLRVRICAPLELRIVRVAQEMNMSLDAAREYVGDIDRGRAKFVADHFKFNVSSFELFDVILDTQVLSVETCAEAIFEAANSMQEALEKTS